jgi:hypothetical protein
MPGDVAVRPPRQLSRVDRWPLPLLRAAVLRAGGLFGWRTPEIIAFVEVLTGCPWPRCGPVELRLVLREYRDFATAAAARAAGPVSRLRRRRGHARRA